MFIKKFKNGNLNIRLDIDEFDEYYNSDMDRVYNELTDHDLYFESMADGMYMVDYNKRVVYDFTGVSENILQYLKRKMFNKKSPTTVKFTPLPFEDGLKIVEELNNRE